LNACSLHLYSNDKKQNEKEKEEKKVLQVGLFKRRFANPMLNKWLRADTGEGGTAVS
jgi:hypothetical protein